MNRQQALEDLEDPQINAAPAIEALITDADAPGPLLERFAAVQAGVKPPPAAASPLAQARRWRFRWTPAATSPFRSLVVRRIVVALGATRSTHAVPALLDSLTRAPADVKLGQALGWALANIGEAALLPLLVFGRRRSVPAPARALAIVTVGYIDDPRRPTVLHHLWREYCHEEPCLVIAALLGLTIGGQGQEARARAAETERLWQARESRRDASLNAVLLPPVKMLRAALREVNAAEVLPAWPSIVRSLASV